jgi:hypothetical protein
MVGAVPDSVKGSFRAGIPMPDRRAMPGRNIAF